MLLRELLQINNYKIKKIVIKTGNEIDDKLFDHLSTVKATNCAVLF